MPGVPNNDGARVGEVFGVVLKLGCTSFSGPIAYLRYFQIQFVARPTIIHGGNREALAADALQNMGYPNVWSIECGLNVYSLSPEKRIDGNA
jgi:hypothetical protein